MEQKKALRILQQQLDQLSSTGPESIKPWRDTTVAYLEGYMDAEKQAFKDFKFYQENDVPGLRQRLKRCIDVVHNLGVHGPVRANWICRISEGWAIALVCSILIPSFGFAFWLGTQYPAKSEKPEKVSQKERTQEAHQMYEENIH